MPPLILIGAYLILLISYNLSKDLSIYSYWRIGMILRFCWLIFGFVFLIFLFKKFGINSKGFSKNTEGVITSYYMIFIMILVAEIALTFVTKTNSIEHSYSTLNWHVKYGGPRNSKTFRDEEFALDDKKLIIFMGDSFTQGFGINNYKDRYSDYVEQHSMYNVWNMGIPGADLKTYISLISSFEVNPEILYIQFFFNDVIRSGYEMGQEYSKNEKITKKKENNWMMGSYLVNHIYCWIKLHQPQKDSYIDYINNLVDNKEVWNDYAQDIEKIKQMCDSMNSTLKIVVFPYMKNPDLSLNYVNKVRATTDSLNIEALYVEDFIKDIPIKKRIVNKNDSHASELINKLVGDKILEGLNNSQN